MERYDAIVVGCGFAGAVVAHQLAKRGRGVLLIEKRGHVGGNMYDALDDSGVLVHRYGPHIFHTNNRQVFEFLAEFSEWFPYEHRVLARINGTLAPLPFSFASLDKLYEKAEASRLKAALAERYGDTAKVSVLDLLKSESEQIRAFGGFVYDNVFARYSAKQWGVAVEDVDKSVIDRVPVLLGYDDRYFQDEIQLMPKDGFTRLFEKMLHVPGVTVRLGTDATEIVEIDPSAGQVLVEGREWTKPLVYTGPIDELLGYRFGALPYRSLELAFEQHAIDRFQPVAVVNYPNEERFTRITEFKQLTGQRLPDRTTILKEYPVAYDPRSPVGNIPYYPVINAANLEQYAQYRSLAETCRSLYLCGRLADYHYYNMDGVIARALEVAERVSSAGEAKTARRKAA